MPRLSSSSTSRVRVLGAATFVVAAIAPICAQEVPDAEKLWSWAPVRDVASPSAGDSASRAIDAFLEARLEAEGLKPAGATDARRLLRRITFALTGLPPTPAEIREFGTAPTDAAYAAVVDRLLASPAFGERWGRHWLDVARFAESTGGGRSLMFANAWRFRDYVIDAYNADVPFDRFLTEQVAGDLLPHSSEEQRNRQLVASGFLELGAINYELQDKELLRFEVIDEQIDTVGQAFLAMTLGCARCHDHKFDPVTARDYYALAGIFGSTQALTEGNVSGWGKREFVGSRTEAWHAWHARRRVLEKRLDRLQPSKKAKRARRIDRGFLRGIVLDDVAARKVGVWIPSTSVGGFLDVGYLHDENTEKGQKSVTFTPRVVTAGQYELRISYTHGQNRASNAPVRVHHAQGETMVRIDQRRPPKIAGSWVTIGRFQLAAGNATKITISNDETDGHVIVDAVQLVPVADVRERPEPNELARAERALTEWKKREPAKPHVAMAVRDRDKPEDVHVRIRGLVRLRGDLVPRGFLEECAGEKPEIPDGASGRLELARWLTSPDHPLTARVYVNRVWHWLFGTGLVRTVDNFGFKGERPSHPDLLDWLARRFAAGGWSTKKLIRDIVLSRAFRRSSGAPPAADPENRWLSVYPRRRLDAEAIRDAVLAVSGRLDRVRGGKTIRKMAQYDYGYVFESRRRSVYIPRFRSNRLQLFDLFDAPDPSMVAGARTVSNVAPQSLYLMNSDWILDQAEHAAQQHARLELPPDEGLTHAYLATLGREPLRSEREIASRYLERSSGTWAGLFHALFASLDFRYVD